MTFVSEDDRGARALIRVDPSSEVFGVELRCELCRVDYIAKQYSDLPPLSRSGADLATRCLLERMKSRDRAKHLCARTNRQANLFEHCVCEMRQRGGINFVFRESGEVFGEPKTLQPGR